jgi:hypothetical protein
MSVYNKVGTNGYRNRTIDITKKFLSRNFHKSDGFGEYNVIRNGVTLDSPIPMNIFTTTSDGVRKFYSHPDNPIYKGDIIDYTDDGFKYLVFEQDQHTTVNTFGKIAKLEYSLKWRDENNLIHETPFFIPRPNIGMQDQNSQLPLTRARNEAWLQFNDETKTIYDNQRFILGNLIPFKVTSRDNFSDKGIFKIALERSQELDGDDFINGIAYNNIDVNTIPTDGKTGVFFTNDSFEIRVGMTDTIEIYEYNNDIIDVGETFTFSVDGIDSSNYDIISTDGNSISIKANGYYYSGELVAIKDGDLSEYRVPLILKSIF